MSTSNQVTKFESLSALIRRPEYAGRFQQIMKERSDQFISSIIQVGQTMPDVEPRSIIAAGMMAASLDLPVNKSLGFAWIVPYNIKGGGKLAQFQVGYKGYIQLGLRSGAYARMNATPINSEAINGYDDVVGEPRIDWAKLDTLKPAVGYAFGFRLTNGFGKLAVWSKAECRSHAERFSQSYRAKAAIWTEFEDQMFLKTVISNELRTWGILSVQMQRAMFVDQSAARDVDQQPQFIDGAETAGMITGDPGAGGSITDPNDERALAEAGLAPEIKSGQQSKKDDAAEILAAEQRRKAKAEASSSMAAQTQQPTQSTTPAASTSTAVSHGMSPQEIIAKGCTEHGITFEQFRKWLSPSLKDADSIATWDQLPTEKCKVLLLSGEALYDEVNSPAN